MSETLFQILVNGKLVEGISAAQAKQNMAALFKVSEDKIEPMFSGRKLAIKKSLSKEAAMKYKAAINKAGLLAGIAPMEPPVTATAPAAPDAPPPTTNAAPDSLDNASIAPAGSIVDDSPPPSTPDIDTSALAMGMTGIELDDTPPAAEPDINISAYSMGGIGEDVTEHQETPEPDIDISSLSAAEVGADVSEAVDIPQAEIDISALSVAATGEDVMEHVEVAPANIDISNISLDQENK